MRISRRTMLASTAAGAAGLALATPGRLLAQQGTDTIRLAVSASGPRELDPIRIAIGADFWVSEQIHENLVSSPDGTFATENDEFEPTLAESWTVSDDARTWTFVLREGVQFHGGYGEVTPDDVIFSFQRNKDEGNSAEIYAHIESMEATGDREVTFNLSSPDPLFLGAVVSQMTSKIVSRAAVEELGEDYSYTGIGTGPYKVDNFDSQTGVFLSRFDDYWGEPAQTANVEILHIADTTAPTLAAISGDVDMIEAVRSPGWIAQIQNQAPSLIIDRTTPGSFNTLHINLTHEPFDDLKVRQALAHSIDREAMAAALAPLADPSWTFSPPGYPTGFAEEDIPEELRYSYDPERARQLLAEAGHEDGVSFSTAISQREDYASIMMILQEMIRPAGFDMQLEVIEHSSYHARIREDANTLSLYSASYPPVPMYYFTRYLNSSAEVQADSSGGLNLSHYGVAMPGVDEKLAEMANATTLEEYYAIGREIELQVQRDLPIIELVTLGYTVMRNPRIELGYEVQGGYARWPLDRAVKS